MKTSQNIVTHYFLLFAAGRPSITQNRGVFRAWGPPSSCVAPTVLGATTCPGEALAQEEALWQSGFRATNHRKIVRCWLTHPLAVARRCAAVAALWRALAM